MLDAALEEWVETRKRDRLIAVKLAAEAYELALISGEGLEKLRPHLRFGPRIGLVRASTYSSVSPVQELVRDDFRCDENLSFRRHPERPVLLRGGIRVQIERHALTPSRVSENGYALALVERWIRLRRITSFDPDHFEEVAAPLLQLIHGKYHTSWHFAENLRDLEPGHKWVGDAFLFYYRGKKTFVHPEAVNLIRARAVPPKTIIVERRVRCAPTVTAAPLATRRRRERIALRALTELGLINHGDLR